MYSDILLPTRRTWRTGSTSTTLYVCMYICIYTYIHLYIYVYVNICRYIHKYTHTNLHTYIYILISPFPTGLIRRIWRTGGTSTTRACASRARWASNDATRSF